MPQPRVYKPADRPDVEVLVDDTWCEGELWAWNPVAGGWVATVQWRRGPGTGNYLTTFPAGQVRRVDGHTPGTAT